MGVFFDLTLGYKSWAFLGFTARNDWSSTLPKNHRSYFYPAVTGSFVFSDAFNLQSNMFNFGKIRVGWAKVGRDADRITCIMYMHWEIHSVVKQLPLLLLQQVTIT